MRGIPTISTFHWEIDGIYVTSELVMLPMSSAPIARLRPPDKVAELAPDFLLPAYTRAEDG